VSVAIVLMLHLAGQSPAGFCAINHVGQDAPWVVDGPSLSSLPAGIDGHDAIYSLDAVLGRYSRASRSMFRHRVVNNTSTACSGSVSCLRFRTNAQDERCAGFSRGPCVWGWLCGWGEQCVAGMCQMPCTLDNHCTGTNGGGGEERCGDDNFCVPRTVNGYAGSFGWVGNATICTTNILLNAATRIRPVNHVRTAAAA
jgi:hypothetical protein